MASRTERLDDLKLNREHGRLILGSGIGWALDAMDVGLVSFVIAALVESGFATKAESGLLASLGFAGMAVGATIGGLVADRVGRRQVFALTLLIYGIATGASALATGVGALMVLRFIIGLGLGAELPVASTLVSEFAPKKIRGRIVVWLEAFWALGWLGAALIGRFVVGAGDAGWRWALAVGAIPAAYAIYVRLGLPESVRFLEAKGRLDEAEAAVARFERASGVRVAQPAAKGGSLSRRSGKLDAAAPQAAGTLVAERPEAAERSDAETLPAETSNARDNGGDRGAETAGSAGERSTHQHIWSHGLRGRTAAFWVVWFCINFSYYGAFIWIPSLLIGKGYDLVQSFSFTLIMTLAQLPGYAAAAWLIEAWGRRVTLGVFLAGSAVSAGAYGLADSTAMIIAAGCCLSFCNLGAWGALYAIGPELYPTSLRGTGTGAAAGFGRLASIIAPMLVPLLVSTTNAAMVFAVFAAAFALAAVAAFTLPEGRGKPLLR